MDPELDLDALYDAAIAGDADAIATLKMEADKLDENDRTILHTESKNGNTERVRFIVTEFADKNLLVKLDDQQQTALTWAAYLGHTEVVEVLIEAARQLPPSADDDPVSSFQAFLRQVDKDSDTALHSAVIQGNESVVKLLVEADPTDRHTQNDEGKTPMYIAVENGFDEIVEIISTTCTAPSLDGPYGSTVVRVNDLDQDESPGGTLYKILDADTVFDAAIAGDAVAIAKLELEADKLNYYGETILHVQSELGKTEYVLFVLREFSNKNLLVKVNTYKQTALHLAAYNGHTKVAEVLIDAAKHLPPSANDKPDISSFQAFLRQGDEDKDTALHLAVENDHVDIVKLLVEADPADRHIQNDEGETPLYIAAENGYFEIVKAICTTCTAPSLDGPERSTALHAFISNIDEVKEENKEVTRMLIDAARHLPPSANDNPITSFQAFLRQGDENKDTALHLAVESGDVGVVKLLVEADPADRHIQNNDGETPLYTAAKNGQFEIVKAICTTCTAPSLEGPERTTALHAFISNMDEVEEENKEVKEENKEVTRMLIDAAKKLKSSEEGKNQRLEAFFSRTDKDGLCLLELAAGKNDRGVVKLLLENDPAYRRRNKKNSVMRSIFISVEKVYKEMEKLLTEAYEEAGKTGVHKGTADGLIRKPKETGEGGKVAVLKGVVSFIVAIKNHDKDEIKRHLKDEPSILNFTEDEGWTPLHYAAYDKFDLILEVFIEEQKQLNHSFSYGDRPTPFHVAAEKGSTSTLKQLMQLWPPQSSSAFSAVNKVGRNILHIAAAASNKEMIQYILRYCPPPLKETMLKKQDAEGNTFFHLLFKNGCYIPEVIKHEGLVTMTKNKEDRTPRDMLYFTDTVIDDQAKIKLALDDEVQTKRSRIFWWKHTKKKPDFLDSIVRAREREDKDEKFNEKKISWKAAKHERMERERRENLVRYKERTNTQIIVCALITTVTFTVGFTMPGGLYQSGAVNEGMVVLSKRTAFHTFMVSDALALLLSTSSLFFYFLGSMTEDDHQVAILGVASTVFNIVSIVAMMLTFIAGTYVVLSDSPALAITVCVISSLFFLLLIVFLVKFVFDRRVKKIED